MSSHMSFYLGAFIEFPKVKIIEKVSINRCSNPGCTNHSKFTGSSKFCPDCGKIIEKHNYSHAVERILELEDLNDIEDNTVDWYNILCSTNGLNVYTSNKKGHTGIWYWYDSAQEIQIISADDIEKMKATFTSQLTKEGFFEFVQKHFNIAPEVKFGTFTSWD